MSGYTSAEPTLPTTFTRSPELRRRRGSSSSSASSSASSTGSELLRAFASKEHDDEAVRVAVGAALGLFWGAVAGGVGPNLLGLDGRDFMRNAFLALMTVLAAELLRAGCIHAPPAEPGTVAVGRLVTPVSIAVVAAGVGLMGGVVGAALWRKR